MLGRIFRAVRDYLYGVVAAIANGLGIQGPPPPPWNWTMTDELGQANTQINDMFKRYMQDAGIKAAQFALRVSVRQPNNTFGNGGLAMSTAYTWAEPGYFITQPGSVMRIASCSKIFTTAAVLDLIQNRHLLTGQEKVFDFLGISSNDSRVSSSPQPRDHRVFDITVQHLVKHAGGWNVPDHFTHDWVFRLREIGQHMGLHRPVTKQEFAEFMFNVPLDFTPGTDSKYSNIGYLLLGLVIEKASGSSYINYVTNNLLTPLSISDVAVAKTRLAGRLGNEVYYEDPFFGADTTLSPFVTRLVPLPYGGFGTMTEVMDSGGGLLTSAKSLAKFIYYNNVLVSDITDNPGRNDGQQRDGDMAGTSSVAASFSLKDGSKQFDMAMIFNSFDAGGNKMGPITTNDGLQRFVDSIKAFVLANF